MSLTREQVCQSTSAKLSAAKSLLGSISATIGLDGFVDQIIAVVDKRFDKDRYEPIRTIEAYGQKILRAAGQSSNYELLVKQTKLGGNGPIMSNALASAGMKVTYIGNLGYPDIHPVFEEFTRRARVISIAGPGYTDALEFEDGKLMLGKHQTLKDVSWENLLARVGKEQLGQLMNGAKLIGMVNWTMLPNLSDIWSRLLSEYFSTGPRHESKFFVDLADPEKRTREDILNALGILTRIQERMDVILGLNLKESNTIAEALGIAVATRAGEAEPGEGAIESTAAAIRKKTNLSCVVIHPRRGAAAATANESAQFAGPFVQSPRISTGAGDHFNAGFCLGRVIGLGLQESLCTGVATSGYYVRSAQSPSAGELADFIAKLPPPQA